MRKYIIMIWVLLVGLGLTGQVNNGKIGERGRISPAVQLKKANGQNQFLFAGEDSIVRYYSKDTVIAAIVGAPTTYYGTPFLSVTNDSLRSRDVTYNPISQLYELNPSGGRYVNNVVNKKVQYVVINDTLLVNYSTDFGNDTLRVSPPPKYKVYTALLTQSGTSAPTAIVLDNTLGGAVIYTYESTGYYSITSSALFAENKTAIIIGSSSAYQDSVTDVNTAQTDSSILQIYTVDSNNTVANSILNTTLIEIRVYN